MPDGIGLLPAPVLLLGVAVLLMLEGALLAGLLVPSTSIALGAGVLAQLGELPSALAVTAVAVGVAAGGQLGYRRGLAGPVMLGGRFHRLAPAVADLLTVVRGRRALGAVTVGQWLSFGRTLVPRIAGAAGMPRHTFTVAQTVFAASWASVLVTAGHVGSAATRQNLGIAPALLAAVAGGAVALRAARRSTTRPSPTRTESP